MTTDIPVTRHIPTIPAPTISEQFASLVARGFHPMLVAMEGGRHPFIAYVRGGADVGGATPDAAMTALLAWVEAKAPPTTRELRRSVVDRD